MGNNVGSKAKQTRPELEEGVGIKAGREILGEEKTSGESTM